MSVAELCGQYGVPCVGITGRIPGDGDIKVLVEAGMTCGLFSLSPGPITLQESMEKARGLIVIVAENITRTFYQGWRRRQQD
jgi:glycerate kinase